MRRILTGTALVAALGSFSFLALGTGSGGGDPSYWVELDNAFGLITGGDAKVAGVRAGKITDLELCTPADVRAQRCSGVNRALVKIDITATGWGSLRRDVQCQTRPQSLIGEYFIDCLPGTSPQVLKPGSTIPVTQTSSTIAPDLVNDIMREPYKQRLRIILNELGAGVAGNAQSINQAVSRAVPALRETDRVLAVLASQHRILADLATKANTVVSALAANRSDVARWVVSAKNAAQASAERRIALAASLRKLPGFLEQLRPAMAQLDAVADNQTPALSNLNASAHQLDLLVRRLKPFAQASLPAFRNFGQAARTGRAAVQAATPTVAQLNKFASGTPELGRNLAIVLGHLDNPAYAVESDPRAPGGRGWSGLESLLNYVFWQSTSINVFDQSEHLLNTSNFVPSECGTLEDAKAVRANLQLIRDCANYLGPTQPGINAPDLSAGQAGPTSARNQTRGQSGPQTSPTPAGPVTAIGSPSAGGPAALGLRLPDLGHILPGAPQLPGAPRLPSPAAPPGGSPQLPGVNVPVPSLPHGATGQRGPGGGAPGGSAPGGNARAPGPGNGNGNGGGGGSGGGPLLSYLLGP